MPDVFVVEQFEEESDGGFVEFDGAEEFEDKGHEGDKIAIESESCGCGVGCDGFADVDKEVALF